MLEMNFTATDTDVIVTGRWDEAWIMRCHDCKQPSSNAETIDPHRMFTVSMETR